MHSKHLETLLENSDIRSLVLERDGRVIGFATVLPRPSFYFVDDMCFSEDVNWRTESYELFQAIEERPAIATLAHSDSALINGALENGLSIISTHRLFKLGNYKMLGVGSSGEIPDDLPDPPTHVFTPMMDRQSLVMVEGEAGGYAICSHSIAPPPILDIGGTSAVIDRVVGNDRRNTMERCLSFLQARGDVGAIVIVDARDDELAGIVESMGASHPVDVLRWPAR